LPQNPSLVEIMKKTDWWPLDLPSLHEGEIRGQIVVLERISQDNWVPFRWRVHSEMTDATSLPLPFNGYDMICGTTTPSTHCRVLVAANKETGQIDPLTDCCALVPFDPINNTFLTPKGRVELGQQAIEACLRVNGQWPNPVKTLAELFPDHIRLEPGRPVAYDPTEWVIAEGKYRDAVIRTYLMSNMRARLDLGVMIAAGKETQPESIDPYRDCCAKFDKPSLLTKLYFRLYGYKAPSNKEIEDLARAAIAVVLDSLGAWPPGRDIPQSAERVNHSTESYVAETARLLMIQQVFQNQFGSVDQAADEFEQALTAFHKDFQERVRQLNDASTGT
jgi:hypothetical protein